ncbi:hypothetical protein ACKWTF_014877 [Chironomus riparius]
MNSFKTIIFACLIYQAFAGGPGLPSSIEPPPSFASSLPVCIRCSNIFKNGEAPSHNDCEPGATQKVILTIDFNGVGQVSGSCTDPEVDIFQSQLHESIMDYSTDIPLQFLSFGG